METTTETVINDAEMAAAEKCRWKQYSKLDEFDRIVLVPRKGDRRVAGCPEMHLYINEAEASWRLEGPEAETTGSMPAPATPAEALSMLRTTEAQEQEKPTIFSFGEMVQKAEEAEEVERQTSEREQQVEEVQEVQEVEEVEEVQETVKEEVPKKSFKDILAPPTVIAPPKGNSGNVITIYSDKLRGDIVYHIIETNRINPEDPSRFDKIVYEHKNIITTPPRMVNAEIYVIKQARELASKLGLEVRFLQGRPCGPLACEAMVQSGEAPNYDAARALLDRWWTPASEEKTAESTAKAPVVAAVESRVAPTPADMISAMLEVVAFMSEKAEKPFGEVAVEIRDNDVIRARSAEFLEFSLYLKR